MVGVGLELVAGDVGQQQGEGAEGQRLSVLVGLDGAEGGGGEDAGARAVMTVSAPCGVTVCSWLGSLVLPTVGRITGGDEGLVWCGG
ncbi:hypothetical protein AF335_06175 [Streptomyces eurocidicus]|uniref:Uncharacterized protein n=1 Tax=Streptomyces eurocidicus TaxID=66423 RepID=A0A2N8NZQ3_STREU|nr:hypothetical protein AF335_06175 [Streptomyces eurocidicus]